MLSNHIGEVSLEWIVVLVLVIAVVGVVIYNVSSSAATQGGNLRSWITNLNMPTSP